MLEKLQQYMKSHQVLTIIASVVLVWAIYNYSGNKSMFPEYMSTSTSSGSNRRNRGAGRNGSGPGVPMPVDDSSVYNQLDSVAASSSSSIGLPPNCSGQPNINPRSEEHTSELQSH